MDDLPLLTRDLIVSYDQLLHPVWLFSVKTLRILASNRAAQSWLGYDAGQMLSKTIADLRPADEKDRIVETVRAFDDTQRDVGIWTFVAASGEHLRARIH